MKIAVAGGGTGGHTLPVLAVIKSLEKEEPSARIFFIGSRFGLESQLIPKIGIKYYGISTGKFRRYHRSKILNIIDLTTLFKNMSDFFKFLRGINEARKILVYERPDVVFAKGGFVSLPVGYAARWLKIPLVVHESDTVLGMANRLMSKFSAVTAVTFPPKFYPELRGKEVVETGTPIRADILEGERGRYLKSIGFDENKKTLLVLGGSQGSLFLNENVLEITNEILTNYQLIWIAGERDADLINFRLRELPESQKNNLKVYGFVTSEMADIYDASDLVISRAGSNVLFELAALGKPAILVPIETIAGGHQFENARFFSRSGGCYIFRQSDVTPKKLFAHVRRLFEDNDELETMSKKMKTLSDIKSADKIAKIILQEGEKHLEQIRKTETK